MHRAEAVDEYERLEPPVAGPKGTVYLRYGLAYGPPGTGDMSAPDRGAGRDD